MNFFWFVPYLLLFFAFYLLLSKKRTGREGAGFVLAVIAALPAWDGGLLLYKEYGRWEHGVVSSGVVVERLSSTGADGTRTIGGRRFSRPSRRLPYLRTGRDFRFYDILARLILTGSKNAWVIEYRYPCATVHGCIQRETVSQALWSELRAGQPVNVRSAKWQRDTGRLDENPMWEIALVKLAIGGIIALAAAAVAGRVKLPRRRLVTVPAVVTSVSPVASGESTHWRVDFAYFADGGTAFESSDIFYSTPKVKSGDSCTVVYPPDRPGLGTLHIA